MVQTNAEAGSNQAVIPQSAIPREVVPGAADPREGSLEEIILEVSNWRVERMPLFNMPRLHLLRTEPVPSSRCLGSSSSIKQMGMYRMQNMVDLCAIRSSETAYPIQGLENTSPQALEQFLIPETISPILVYCTRLMACKLRYKMLAGRIIEELNESHCSTCHSFAPFKESRPGPVSGWKVA